MNNPFLHRIAVKIISVVYRKDINAATMCPEAYAGFLHYVGKIDPDMVEDVRELIHARMEAAIAR